MSAMPLMSLRSEHKRQAYSGLRGRERPGLLLNTSKRMQAHVFANAPGASLTSFSHNIADITQNQMKTFTFQAKGALQPRTPLQRNPTT